MRVNTFGSSAARSESMSTVQSVIAARDFFLDALTVDLAAGDIVTEIVMPKPPPETGWGFYEVARRSGDFALAEPIKCQRGDVRSSNPGGLELGSIGNYQQHP